MDWQGGFQLRGARSDQATRPVKHTREKEDPDQTRVRTPWKGQEQSQTELNHGENWKTQPSREPQKFPRGKVPLDPTVNRQIQRRKKSPLPSRDSAEATDLNRNGVKNTSAQGRGNDHQALTHQTTLPPGRETNGMPAPGPRAILRHLPQA